MSESPSLMTVEEVAEFVRVRPSTVYDWAKDGKIPASKVGRLWRFHRDEIDELVRNGGLQGKAKDSQREGN